MGQSSERGISDFRIADQSLINKNCHNFKTSNDIDMKFGPITELTFSLTVISYLTKPENRAKKSLTQLSY